MKDFFSPFLSSHRNMTIINQLFEAMVFVLQIFSIYKTSNIIAARGKSMPPNDPFFQGQNFTSCDLQSQPWRLDKPYFKVSLCDGGGAADEDD